MLDYNRRVMSTRQANGESASFACVVSDEIFEKLNHPSYLDFVALIERIDEYLEFS